LTSQIAFLSVLTVDYDTVRKWQKLVALEVPLVSQDRYCIPRRPSNAIHANVNVLIV